MAPKLSPLRVLLLAGASAVAVSTAAHAAPQVLFASGSGVAQGPIAPGQPVTSTGGVTQVQLDSGAVVSFVGPSVFSVGTDGALEIQSGNITLGGGTAPILIRLAGGGSLNASAGASASFAISPAGTIAGQVMTGSATLATAGGSQTFTSAQFFSVQPGGAPIQTFAGLAPQATPSIVGAGLNIGGYNPILNAAIQQNPALTTLPIGQSQTQLANYLVSLGQTIGQLFTPAQLLQLAQQYGPQTPTPTPTTPTPTPTTPTPTPTTPTPTPTTPTPTPTTPTPTPTTPTPTPTTPTPTPTTPTPTPTTPTNASGLTNGQTVPAGAIGRNVDNQVAGTGDAGNVIVGVDAGGNPNRIGNATVTTATLAQVDSAAGWTVGRYSNGVVQQANGATTADFTFTANNGMAFYALTPVTGALPTTGVAIYDTLSATTPILYDGSAAPGGSFTAKLGIDLGTARKIGLEGVLTVPQGTGAAAYNFTTAGGAAAPSAGLLYGSGLNLNFEGRAPVTTTGTLCGASGCELFMRGSLGGANGQFAGAIYEMRDTASGRYPVGGAVVLSRTSLTTPTPTPTTPTPTPTTPTPTPTTPTPTPTTPTPTPTTGVNGVSPPTGASNMLVAKATLTENAGFESDKATLALGAGSFEGYDINNGLTQFRRQGTQVSAEYYADKGVIGIARWSGGTGVLGSERGPTQGDHFVFGSKATALPAAGLFTFDLAAFTQPTIRNGATSSTGNVTGRASVSFFGGTATNAGLDFTVLVNGSTYVVRSPGGLTAPSLGLSNGVLTGSPFRITSGAGPACTGATCEVAYGGFLSGTAASNLGLVYTIYNPAVSTTTGRVDGAVLFGNPTTPTQTAAGQFNQAFMSRATPAAGTEGAPLGSRGLAITPTGDAYSITSIDRFLGAGTTFPDQFTAQDGSGATVTVTASSVSGLNQGGYIGRMGWVRWNGRTVINGVTSDLTNVPIVWLTPLSGAAPTGRANYELMGATDPVIGAAQNGGSFKGALVVDFATSLVGWDTVLTMTGERLNFYSEGRLAAPSVTLASLANGQRRFSGSGLVAAESLACGGCAGTMTGLIGGPDASEAGVTYLINSYFGPITGAAAFRREGGLGRITGAPVGGPVQGAYTNGNQISAGLYTNTQVDTAADGQARSLGDATRGTTSGAAKNIEYGGDGGQIGWTRWYDGSARVNGSNRGYEVNNGVHLVWGAPVTNMPTSGVANYTLVGATKPTVDTFNTTTAPGEFAGTFAVDFASLKAGLSSTVTMGPTVYNLSSSGGSAAPSMAIDPANGTFAVSTTVNGQFGSIYGFLAGQGASHAGVSYRFLTAPNVYIGGVAAFRK